MLITSAKYKNRISLTKIIVVNDDDIISFEKSIQDNDIAYILYTSGSTGKPKGVMIRKSSTINFIEGVAEIIDFSHGRSIACLTSPAFDIFFLESVMALIKGLVVYVCTEEEQNNPKLLAAFIENTHVDMLQLTPSRMQMLLNYDSNLSCLKYVKDIMIGGEVFPVNMLHALQEKTTANIYNMYGPTETTIWSTISNLTNKSDVDIGMPIKNTRVYIVDQYLPEEDLILYPHFSDYISQISIRIGESVDDAIPVKVQLSNGYCYYPNISGNINTYSFRPTKLKWIKISNCKSLNLFHVVRLNDQVGNTQDSCSLVHWRPLNHIDNWQIRDAVAAFNINGVDPYLICEGVNIDASRYPYITFEYGTDDISDKAQLYFMTDTSPMYSKDKLLTFHICKSCDRYAYKLDLSNFPAWNNIVTMLRLDPVHYQAQYEGDHIRSECSIYSISVSSVPLIYTNGADYTGSQYVNQWEYCSYKDGTVDYLVYDDREKIWGDQDGTHIGLDFQRGIDGTLASRNWRCPAQGKYIIVFSAECDMDTDVYIMLDDDAVIFESQGNNCFHCENTVQLEEKSIVRFANNNGYIEKVYIEIKKAIDT